MYWAIDCIHRGTTKHIHLNAAANQWNLESTKMIQSILCYALVALEYNKLSRKYHKMIEMQVESKLFGVCGSDMFVSILYLILISIHMYCSTCLFLLTFICFYSTPCQF